MNLTTNRTRAMSSPIIQEIQEFLQKQLNKNKPEVILDPQTPLMDTGSLDSLELYNLIVFIEERYGIEINEDQITLENFKNLLAIEMLINQIQAG